MNSRNIIIGLAAAILTMSSVTVLSQETDLAAQFDQAWAEADRADRSEQERFRALVAQMDRQMEAINGTTDPARRAALMREHRVTMAEATRCMQNLKGGAVATLVTEHMKALHTGTHHAAMQRTPSEVRLNQLENQVAMMQTMIEVLVETSGQ